MIDPTLLQNRWLTPLSVAAGQAFISSQSPEKNSPPHDMTGKDGYSYGGGRQYCSTSGTLHCSCAPHSSLLGGIPNAVLPQSHKETHTGWNDIVGKISTSVCFGMFFTSFLPLV